MKLTRRQLLALPLLGLAGRFRGLARAAATAADKHLVLVYLAGGPSHVDTFDPKPGTKSGGPFRAIDTRIAGVQFAEVLPALAERADRLAVVRALTSTEGSHARARYLLHTAYPPNPSVRHAALGASLAHELGDRARALPPYVALGGPAEGAGFLGAGFAPFVVRSNPGQPIENLKGPPDIDARRLDARLELAAAFDADFAKAGGEAEVQARGAMLERARTMMRSADVAAFEVEQESEAARAAYGTTPFGQRCLTARRLIEAGVTAVEIEQNGWDTHEDNFTKVRTLAGELDRGVGALIDDLLARGLFERTVILIAGEFGRTPKINGKDGRDHHPKCFSAVLAGGGLKGGVVVGASDDAGDAPAGPAITIPDVFATVMRALGVDPAKTFTSNDRPIALGNQGKPLAALL